MAKKNANNYFEMFIDTAALACKAAELLDEAVRSYDPQQLVERMHAVHEVEHAADSAKHDLLQRLIREFLPPIDREDILLLAQELDNVVDSIDDVLIKMYMFNVQAPRPEAATFTALIAQCCHALLDTMREFENFRRSSTLGDNIVRINDIEGEGDQLYTEAVHTLFTTAADPLAVTAWVEIFARLERCLDACEHVANVIESVVMKNS